ncbi:MAG TPA: maleylacetoacetate isomerase [Kofleriaceae bacterium]|nr:maleylacetoacetate isomerase [Kofleriaceae bacterium]
MKLVLHNYWRSSASHRVRIALGLKRLPYEYVAVDITRRAQHADGYRARNPLAQVPTLEITEDGGERHGISQSLPILEYLDERWPEVPLLPRDLYLRARARMLAEIVNSGIQPLQNLSTLNRLKELGGDPAAWTPGFISAGLAAFARVAAETAGAFCVGDAPTIADCCLVPQLASARRFGAETSGLGQLLEIEARCLALPAFADAAPDQQPDAVRS